MLIQNGENGLLVPVEEYRAIEEDDSSTTGMTLQGAMERMMTDSALRGKIGENAKAIRESANPASVLNEWLKYAKEIIEKSEEDNT